MTPLMMLTDVSKAGRYKTRRESSYDRAGGNVDFKPVPAGGRHVLMDADGPGVITHIWFALSCTDYNYLRYVSIKAWWDGCATPSIDCPIGDFFGVGHAAANKFDSLLMNMVRGSGMRGEATGMNCFIPMPFATHARIEVVNESPAAFLVCYYQVDWLQTDSAPGTEAGRFHAEWRRENPTAKVPVTEEHGWAWGRFGENRDGKYNYLVADIHGAGRFLGMNLSIDNIDPHVYGSRLGGFNEGDEMIFIDDDVWPPSLHGTGTEDYFCDAWGMTGTSGLYTGTSLPGCKGTKAERGTCYRFHVWDPVYFGKNLRFTFEHGMNNCQGNDLASTAFWYQPKAAGVRTLPPVSVRRPRRAEDEPAPEDEDQAIRLMSEAVNAYYDLFLEGKHDQVVAIGKGLAADTLSAVDQAHSQFLAGKLGVHEIETTLAPYRDALAAIRG